MSLQLSYEDNTGVVHASAYAKVRATHPNYMPNGSSMYLAVDVFHDAAAKTANKAVVATQGYHIGAADFATYFADSNYPGDPGSNPRKQAYAFLKAHVPVGSEVDFRSASDV